LNVDTKITTTIEVIVSYYFYCRIWPERPFNSLVT